MNKLGHGAFGKRTALALARIMVILSLSAVSAAHYLSPHQTSEKENSLPSASPSPTTSPSPSPPPTAPTSISAKASFEGLGDSFEATYTLPSRKLIINGQVFKAANIEILITFRIDESENHTLRI